MKDKGYCRTGQQLKPKWKMLKTDYYKARHQNGTSGEAPAEFPFYGEMDSILTKRPRNHMQLIVIQSYTPPGKIIHSANYALQDNINLSTTAISVSLSHNKNTHIEADTESFEMNVGLETFEETSSQGTSVDSNTNDRRLPTSPSISSGSSSSTLSSKRKPLSLKNDMSSVVVSLDRFRKTFKKVLTK